MKGLILLVSLVHIAIGLPQQGSFQDFNRDRDRDQHGSQQGNPQDPFANRNFLPQTFSGNVNNTSSRLNPSPFPSRDGDRDSFDNVNYRTTESTTRSTTRSTSRYDDRNVYEHDRTEYPRGEGGHDQPFGVSPSYETQRTNMSPNNNQHSSGDHRPKGVNDRSYSSGASVNQSIAFYLIGFCYLLKFY